MSSHGRVVDPELADLVRLASEAPALPPERAAVGQLRERSRAAAIAHGPGPDLSRVEERVIPGPRGPIPVRVHHPDVAPMGVLVFFHGSGFVIFARRIVAPR